MWFLPSGDPKQFLRALKLFAVWLILGPLIGAALVGLVGLLVAGIEGAKTGVMIGLAFGAMGGVVATGAKVISEWET